eukprot:13288638-Ditylum_brightwellii.AAC.1
MGSYLGQSTQHCYAHIDHDDDENSVVAPPEGDDGPLSLINHGDKSDSNDKDDKDPSPPWWQYSVQASRGRPPCQYPEPDYPFVTGVANSVQKIETLNELNNIDRY